MSKFNLHLVSDATGETLQMVANAAKTQFIGYEPKEYIWSMIRSPEQMQKVIAGIQSSPGVVLYTLVDKNLQRHFVNIEDLMTGIYSVIDSNEFFKSDLHIRGKKKYTLEEIVDKIVTLTNSNTKIKYLNNNAIAYDFECANNIPALQDVTSWIPKVSLQSGLKKILRDGPN